MEKKYSIEKMSENSLKISKDFHSKAISEKLIKIIEN